MKQFLTDPAESKNLSADHPAVVKQLADLAEQSRTTLGDHAGPGKEARFFDPGEYWPSVITSTDAPEKKSTAIPKAKHKP